MTVRRLEEHLSRPAVLLRCQCGLPWIKIQNGCIIVQSRHHGETHTNTASIDMLRQMAEAQAEHEGPESS